MEHIMSDLSDGAELEVTEVTSEGNDEISSGDTFTVVSVREKSDMPDGSTALCKFVAEIKHNMPHRLGTAQLKSVNKNFDEVIIPNCQGGSRVKVQKV